MRLPRKLKKEFKKCFGKNSFRKVLSEMYICNVRDSTVDIDIIHIPEVQYIECRVIIGAF